MTDKPEIQEIDINPLLADENGVLALDARVRIAPSDQSEPDRLAIRPYPQDLEETIQFAGRPLTIRPIRPEDEPQHRDLFNRLRPDDIRFRFGALREPAHAALARFTQIDYDREMALVATRLGAAGHPETLGVVRTQSDSDNEVAEFSIIIRSDLKGQGLGSILLNRIIAYCRARRTARLVGQILPDNRRMLALAREYGFAPVSRPDRDVVEVSLDLQVS